MLLLQRERGPAHTLTFGLLASRIVREEILVVLSQVGDNLLQQP